MARDANAGTDIVCSLPAHLPPLSNADMSLFYIAFIKRYTTNNPCRIGKSGKPDCMMELEFQLMSLVITKATLQQVMEVGIPFITSRIKQWRARSRSNRHLENAREEPGGPQLGASSAHNRYVEESHLAPYNSTIEGKHIFVYFVPVCRGDIMYGVLRC